MNVHAKLEKRKNELNELKSICEDFSDKLADMKDHLEQDMNKIEERKSLSSIQTSALGALVDENGNPVNLLVELVQV